MTSVLLSGVAPDTEQLAMFFGGLVLMVFIVAVIYAKKGSMVVLRISLYILSLSTIKIGVRNAVATHNFPFPKFLNASHFFCSGLSAWAILLGRSYYGGPACRPISVSAFFGMVVPISLAFSLSTCLNNEAIAISSANFVELAGTAGPLCTAFVAFAMDDPLPTMLYVPLLVVTVGLGICVSGDVKYTHAALWLVSGANLLRSVKSILQQILMNGKRRGGGHVQASEVRLDPLELLAWMSIPAFTQAAAWSVISEGSRPVDRLQDGNDTLPLVASILLTCAQATVLNVFSIWAVKDLGALGAQLAGNLKGALALLGGVAVLGEPVAMSQIVGFVIVLFGIAWFSRAQHDIESRQPSAQEPEMHTKASTERSALLDAQKQQGCGFGGNLCNTPAERSGPGDAEQGSMPGSKP